MVDMTMETAWQPGQVWVCRKSWSHLPHRCSQTRVCSEVYSTHRSSCAQRHLYQEHTWAVPLTRYTPTTGRGTRRQGPARSPREPGLGAGLKLPHDTHPAAPRPRHVADQSRTHSFWPLRSPPHRPRGERGPCGKKVLTRLGRARLVTAACHSHRDCVIPGVCTPLRVSEASVGLSLAGSSSPSSPGIRGWPRHLVQAYANHHSSVPWLQGLALLWACDPVPANEMARASGLVLQSSAWHGHLGCDGLSSQWTKPPGTGPTPQRTQEARRLVTS